MKRIMITLVILAISYLFLEIPDRTPPHDPNAAGRSEAISLADRQVGIEAKYSGSMEYYIHKDQGEQTMNLRFTSTLRSIEETPAGTLFSLSIEGPVAENMVADPALLAQETVIFYHVLDGRITQFLTPKNADITLVELAKGIALNMQLPTEALPTPGSKTTDSQESSQNGSVSVSYAAAKCSSEVCFTKHFKKFQDSSDLQFTPGSYTRMVFAHQNHLPKTVESEIGYVIGHNTSELTIRQKYRLHQLGFANQISQHPLTPSQLDSLVASQANSSSYSTLQGQKLHAKRLLEGITDQQLLTALTAIELASDDRISQLFNQLAAKLLLDPGFGHHLLRSLAPAEDSAAYAARLSIVMGALSTMEAAPIETSLLQFANDHRDNEAVIEQVAFAAAELKGATGQTAEFLLDLADSDHPEQSNMGALALGILGEQGDHHQTTMNFLQQQLQQAHGDQKAVYLAAMANSRNPEYLDTLVNHAQDSSDFVAEKAIEGLQYLDSPAAFQGLKKIILEERREGLQVAALNSTQGYLDHEELVPFLERTIQASPAVPVQKAALKVLAAHPDSLYVQEVLEGLMQSGALADRLYVFAEDILATLTAIDQ